MKGIWHVVYNIFRYLRFDFIIITLAKINVYILMSFFFVLILIIIILLILV